MRSATTPSMPCSSAVAGVTLPFTSTNIGGTITDSPELRLAEQFPALHVRAHCEVVAVELQHVEHVVRRRHGRVTAQR